MDDHSDWGGVGADLGATRFPIVTPACSMLDWLQNEGVGQHLMTGPERFDFAAIGVPRIAFGDKQGMQRAQGEVDPR